MFERTLEWMTLEAFPRSGGAVTADFSNSRGSVIGLGTARTYAEAVAKAVDDISRDGRQWSDSEVLKAKELQRQAAKQIKDLDDDRAGSTGLRP